MKSAEEQERGHRGGRPHGQHEAFAAERQRLALPARREIERLLRPHAAQQLIEIALNILQLIGSALGGAILALKAEREADMLQFQHVEIGARIALQPFELLEEIHAAETLAEEARGHAVARPQMAVVGRYVLHDVVGRRANEIFGDIGLLRRDAGAANILVEKGDGGGDLLEQALEIGAERGDAQAPEQMQQRAGGAQNGIGMLRDERVEIQILGALQGRSRLLLLPAARHPGVGRRRAWGARGLERRGRELAVRMLGRTRRAEIGLRRIGGRRLRRVSGRGGRRRRRGGARRRTAPAGIGLEHGAIAARRTERIVLVAHLLSSRMAQSSSSRSGQSPEKCRPIAAATLKSAQSGLFLSM